MPECTEQKKLERISMKSACPKCGNHNSIYGAWIAGPIYNKAAMSGVEHLKFWCERCKYGWKEEVHDAKIQSRK